MNRPPMNRAVRRQFARQLKSQPWPSGTVYTADELLDTGVALGADNFERLCTAARIGTREALELGEKLIQQGLHLVALAGLAEGLERPTVPGESDYDA